MRGLSHRSSSSLMQWPCVLHEPQPPRIESTSRNDPAAKTLRQPACTILHNNIIPTIKPMAIKYDCMRSINQPPNPAKPINVRDSIPATIKTMAVPRTTFGVSAISRSSRIPAIITSAMVKPAPAPRA